MKKIKNTKVDYTKLITYYKRKLVDYGELKELKNQYISKGKYTGVIKGKNKVVA